MSSLDLLIYDMLEKQLRNGGTGAREISRKLPGGIPVATIQRHLTYMKRAGEAAQTLERKWIPDPRKTGERIHRWETFSRKFMSSTPDQLTKFGDMVFGKQPTEYPEADESE